MSHSLIKRFHYLRKRFKREPGSTTVYVLSGEWMLNPRPNGGDVIFKRALYVAVWTYLLALLAYNVFDPQRTCLFNSRPCVFSWSELLSQLFGNFHWFVTIFAAVYVALYARFAAQWTYLANLYNQIKWADARMSRDWSNRKLIESMASWKAAFLEDAETLHLATKGIFVAAVKAWGDDPTIAKMFELNSYDGATRLKRLMENVNSSYARHDQDSKEMNPPLPA